MQRQEHRKGFTLVEIMIVLAILVLLVAMVGPRLLKTQEKADNKIAVTQIQNLEQALDFYKVDNRVYPTTEEGLKALLQKPSDEARGKAGQVPIWKKTCCRSTLGAIPSSMNSRPPTVDPWISRTSGRSVPTVRMPPKTILLTGVRAAKKAARRKVRSPSRRTTTTKISPGRRRPRTSWY